MKIGPSSLAKHGCRRCIPAIMLCVVFLSIVPNVSGESAQRLAKAFMKENGYKSGWNAERNCFYDLEVSYRDIDDINSPDVFRLRDQMVLEALIKSRREIIKARNSELRDEVYDKYKDELEKAAKIEVVGQAIHQEFDMSPYRKIDMDIQSQCLLYGCTILRTEESYNEETKEYTVAVVVRGDLRRLQSAMNAINGEGTIPSLEEDKLSWSTFVPRSDFSHRFGPLQFIDSNGNYHFVGVGFSDVDGKADDELEKAKDEARKSAEQSLACSLWSERVVFDCANRMMKDPKDVAWGNETFEFDFSAQVQTICHSKSIVRYETLFEGNIVRPLTGRQTYVCVVGIPSVEVPKLNILEDDNSEK